ncbi:hypothetical protein TNCV_2969241 [Trichonephila clavipes]|nr:hypothetical protein TNCV_2969241 [Trichonephila clavipes]
MFEKVLNCPNVSLEKFVAIGDANVCTALIMADKDILELVQSSKSITNADSETNNAASVSTSFEIRNIMKIFSSIVREFLELFYNLWRTVLAKNKIVLDPALRLQSFRTLENATIGVRSGIECQQQERWRPSSRLSRKLSEMKSELTASMNTKLTNVNEQISANMDELNNKLTANKEELKSDLKGIGDKLTTMDKKFEEMEGRIESVENKFEDMESKLEAKIFEKVEEVSISFRSDLEKLKRKVMTGQGDEFKFQAPFSKPSIKLSTYDGKSSGRCIKPNSP